ncbi:MAG TPA: fluoride efflux transporter CrcB [Tepidisphaeraceae bacterium]|nr:fluoride efflux transporter CrcB [Tepidisphaeraceae bacterium]
MKQLMLVSLAGAIGVAARWKLSGLVLQYTPDWRFPVATFIVNVAGCLVAGALAGLVIKLNLFGPDARLVLFTGLLGGFTTFSAFGVESVYLLRRAEYAVAMSYITLSVAGGIGGLWLALWLVPGKSG